MIWPPSLYPSKKVIGVSEQVSAVRKTEVLFEKTSSLQSIEKELGGEYQEKEGVRA